MPYTANKKISGLDPASAVADGHELPISQAGTTNRASLTQIQANVFGAKTAKTTVDGTEVVVVRQTDNSLRQVALSSVVPDGNITNAKIAAINSPSYLGITDNKLATIATAGKVSNSATTATNANTANAIVARDGSGNFTAGTITASLSGNATTASSLTPGNTIGMTGDVGYISATFTGASAVTGTATISNNAVTFAKMQDSAAAGLSVVGRSTNTAGDFAEIAAGTDGHVLRRSGTTLGFGQIATAGIADATSTTTGVTNAKLRHSQPRSVIGRTDPGGSGAVADISATGVGQVLRTSSSGPNAGELGFGQIDPTLSLENATDTASGVTNGKIRHSFSCSVIGRSANSTGAIADIQASLDGSVLRRVSNVLEFGTVTNAGIEDGAVDNDKIANGAGIALSKLGSGALPTNITARYSEITDTPYKDSVRLATTANLTATYANGTSGVGATLTNNGTFGALSIDGVAVAASDRILVKDQNTEAQNGIYIVTNTGSVTVAWVLTRATDSDANTDAAAALVTIERGTANAGKIFTSGFASNNTVGTSPQYWYQVVTTGDSQTVSATMLAEGSVTNSKLRNSSALSVIGNGTNASADPADISAGTDGHVLRRSGTSLGFGQIVSGGIADLNVTTAKLATVTQQSLVPVGAVMPFARSTKPAGWLEANGDVVPNGSGTVQGVTADFSALYAAVGTAFGSAGKLPDLRGIFVRGSGSQTISGTAYSGTFAAKQQDDLKSHTHGYTDAGVSQTGLTGGPTPFANTGTTARTTDSTGGTETRPANIALLYCIKF